MVNEVVDGDTITVTLDLGFRIYWKVRMRLFGINAYELTSPDPIKRELAVKGKQYVIEKILSWPVLVNSHMDKGDKYGRWLATVYYIDGKTGEWRNLNEELITEGLALRYVP